MNPYFGVAVFFMALGAFMVLFPRMDAFFTTVAFIGLMYLLVHVLNLFDE